jgi:hypothetical protein
VIFRFIAALGHPPVSGGERPCTRPPCRIALCGLLYDACPVSTNPTLGVRRFVRIKAALPYAQEKVAERAKRAQGEKERLARKRPKLIVVE